MSHEPPRFTVETTNLGPLIVCGTTAGLRLVSLGREAADDFAQRFGTIRRDNTLAHLQAWAGQIGAFLQGQRRDLDLPLDVVGTPFQLQVWQHLRSIGYGQVRTYSAIAQALGRPTAVRAVGNACGANPVCLVVPCHRAIRADGSLGGFRWGMVVKRRLLEMERLNRSQDDK